MRKSRFKLCECGNSLLHGYLYLKDKKSSIIYSLKDTRTILDEAVKRHYLVSAEKLELIKAVESAGITENGPSAKAIEAEKKRQEKFDNEFSDLMQSLGISPDRVISLPIADLDNAGS